MNTLAELYKPSLGLLTDLYQLTMAYGYWKTDMTDFDAVFHLYFRQNPFRSGFTIVAELATAIGMFISVQHWRAFAAERMNNSALSTAGSNALSIRINIQWAWNWGLMSGSWILFARPGDLINNLFPPFF